MVKKATRWNRCKATCGCSDVNVPNSVECACWNTCYGKCERDRRTNAQMRAYAVSVNVALTGVPITDDGYILCPLTNTMVHVSLCEVDKANPHEGYVMGNVVMVSKQGNQERGKLQKYYGDMAGSERYIVDVMNASIGIDILPVSFAFTNRAFLLANTKAIVVCDKNMANVINGPYGV
jgi:hypothetical protein